VQGGGLNNKKRQKLKYVVAIDGRRLIFFTQQPTKNTWDQQRRCRRRESTRGGMYRRMKPSFWGVLEVVRREKTKINLLSQLLNFVLGR
jgi:hypothetical protein